MVVRIIIELAELQNSKVPFAIIVNELNAYQETSRNLMNPTLGYGNNLHVSELNQLNDSRWGLLSWKAKIPVERSSPPAEGKLSNARMLAGCVPPPTTTTTTITSTRLLETYGTVVRAAVELQLACQTNSV